MRPNIVAADQSPLETLSKLVEAVHLEGPDSSKKLEALSLYKEFSPDEFAKIEENLLASMGLFYKLKDPSSLYVFLMKRMGEANRARGNIVLTPVQASVRNAIVENKYVSISAPTSAGKSYSIRDFITAETGDAVIVVPSRALIAEYISSLRTHFAGDKSIMILPFVDNVFTSRELRRIFVLTPERAREVFEKGKQLDLKVFFFDEAQVSEEAGRGVVFDVLVRRVRRNFPNAKMIFAHPFVENPEAQFEKHDFPEIDSFAKSYPQGAVGKVFVFNHSNSKDYYFSPFDEEGHHLSNCVEFAGGFAEFALSEHKSILSYVSKSSIYSGKFTDEFHGYIESLPKINAPKAVEIIETIESVLGADQAGHRSGMISLMRKGVVIHHGSVPLEVRFLIEDFIRQGFAKLCFATSTLAQGVNMPFDIVWLNSMRMQGGDDSKRSLAFKNLIGRAGRLSPEQVFDYGYVYTKSPRLLMEHMNSEFMLSPESILESEEIEVDEDQYEIILAIRDNAFDDELHMPETRLARLADQSVRKALDDVLQLLYPKGSERAVSLRGEEHARSRALVEQYLRNIYEAYLGRELLDGERAVFREAISIMLQAFGGRSFREIAGLRYSRISRRDNPSENTVQFVQQASELPDVNLRKPYPLFGPGTSKKDVSYDVVVFDTYDYLDKVISFCLSDVFAAASKVYYAHVKDDRALKFIELLRFGTNDSMQVMMMRYGFLPEQIEKIAPYVLRVSEDEILFKPSARLAPREVRDVIDWYQPA